jgi:hypothetical protein
MVLNYGTGGHFSTGQSNRAGYFDKSIKWRRFAEKKLFINQ